MKKLIISVLLLNLLAACSSNPPKEETVEPTTAAASSEAPAADANAQAADQGSTEAQPAADVAPEVTSVFFPFDVDAIQDADRETIMNNGAYLAKHPELKVRIEGNADERGSSEYNLGLGQRRANNTKKALVLGGAQPSQIETVSYGEEKPRCTEHNESCWAQNRRADINYSAQ